MRTSPGCIPCKRRRKRCDLTKPNCSACQRNFLLCSWQPQRGPQKEDHDFSRNELTDRGLDMPRDELVCAPTVLNASTPTALRRPQSQFLLNYFLTHTAEVLSVQPQGPCLFLDVLMPVAFQSDMVLQTLLTLSGVHAQQQGISGYQKATWEHQAQALRAVKYGITEYVTSAPHLGLTLSICTLLFCFMEVIRGDTDGNVFYHLNAARHVLLPRETSRLDMAQNMPNLRALMLEWYSYILATSAIGGSQIVEYPFRVFEKAYIEILTIKSSTRGVLFGCAQELFLLLPQAVLLSKQISLEYEVFGCLSRETGEARLTLVDSVQSWKPSSSDKDAMNAGKIYQLALLGLLQIPSEDSSEELWTHNLPNILQSLPPHSRVTTVLCWPLTILGSLIKDGYIHDEIRSYMERIVSQYKFGNFEQSLELLDALWMAEHQSRNVVDLIPEMMKQKGYYFLFA